MNPARASSLYPVEGLFKHHLVQEEAIISRFFLGYPVVLITFIAIV